MMRRARGRPSLRTVHAPCSLSALACVRYWRRVRCMSAAALVLTLALGVLSAMPALMPAARAVAAAPSDDLPDLAAIKARIYAGDYVEAVAALEALSQQVHHAEVFNLLGYSLRQLGRHEAAGRAYVEALYFDGAYRPALQYQGELFIATGKLDAARRNLAYLRIVCGDAGCAELDSLAAALTEAEAGTKAKTAAPPGKPQAASAPAASTSRQ